MLRVTVDVQCTCNKPHRCARGECILHYVTVEPRRVDRRKCGQRSSTIVELRLDFLAEFKK